MGVDYRILFVEASESAIVRRYKESRRPHPLQAESRCSLPEAVRRESELLAPCVSAQTMSSTPRASRSRCCKSASARSLSTAARGAISSSTSWPSASSTASRSTPIWCLTCAFCPTRIMWKKLRPLSGMDDEVQGICPAQRRGAAFSRKAHRHDRFSPAAVRCRGALCAHDRHRLHRRPAPQRGRGQGADGLSRRARRERPSAQPGLPRT